MYNYVMLAKVYERILGKRLRNKVKKNVLILIYVMGV